MFFFCRLSGERWGFTFKKKKIKKIVPVLVKDLSADAALSMGGSYVCFMRWLTFKIKLLNNFQMSGLIIACRSEPCLKFI